MKPQVLDLIGISKAFAGVQALENVAFNLRAGEVRALMGKNGAGKSTLVRIISGDMAPDSGTIRADGETVSFSAPVDATAAGIATVHQELTIIPGLSVAENITLGHWPQRRGILNNSAAESVAREALDQLGETIDPHMPAGELSIAKQQIVEIARALALKPKVLILDEPTSSLPAHEVEALLRLVRRLGETGVAVIYVSHRMDEIGRVADTVTVLRDGRLIDTLPTTEAPVRHIAQLMVGEVIEVSEHATTDAPRSEIALECRALNAGPRVRDISLNVRKGEILGIAGLLGAGRSEFLRVLSGIDRAKSGNLIVGAKEVRHPTIQTMLRNGVALVPEDRKSEGLVLGMSISQNLSMSALGRVASGGILRAARERRLAEYARDLLDIKVSDLTLSVQTLSGGNQQKVVFGRCLNAEVDVLLLDEPTRGVDVQAKQQIYDLIRDLARQGKAIIIVSSEYEELLLLCHRVAIMADGRFVEEFDPKSERMDGLMARLLAANEGTESKTIEEAS